MTRLDIMTCPCEGLGCEKSLCAEQVRSFAVPVARKCKYHGTTTTSPPLSVAKVELDVPVVGSRTYVAGATSKTFYAPETLHLPSASIEQKPAKEILASTRPSSKPG